MGSKIDPSEVTPEHLYLSRRRFLQGLGAVAASAAVLGACAPQMPAQPETKEATPALGQSGFPTVSASQDELGDELTPENVANAYNNYYEFSLDKEEVAKLAQGFVTTPWTVQVGGLVDKAKTFSLEDLLQFDQEQRIYRMRCVEAYSMVIPWIGFPLARLLEQVQPMSQARYVRFEAVVAPEQMPGQRRGMFAWPYVEGLRLDEAMHDLTILATGFYGKLLRPQMGAPVRLVVPWKYGFKSIKAVVKIELVEEMPTTFWMAQAPHEYGFYSNVNPDVPHPRWSQATERRIGELGRRQTLLFNGYEDEVAYLYQGMDLKEWF